MTPVCALSIAGSDSGAGAGIQADTRAMQSLGVLCCTAITAVTAQNTLGIQAWSPVDPELLSAQIDAVLRDLPVRAIKTGLLPGLASLKAVLRSLAPHDKIPLVVDPVLGSSSGTRFLPDDALALLRSELLPRATLVTPNWPELAALCSTQPLRDHNEALDLASRLASDTGCSVLIKGGHSNTPDCTDLLVTPGRPPLRLSSPRIQTPNTHGTGCTLSALLTAQLALGSPLATAATLAHKALHHALATHPPLRYGQGPGPAFPPG